MSICADSSAKEKIKHNFKCLRIEFNQDQLDQNQARFVVCLNIYTSLKSAYEVPLAG